MSRRRKAENGEGSWVYEEARSRWKWQISIKNNITGQSEFKCLYGTNKKKLRERVKKWLADRAAGATTGLNVERWSEIWLEKIVQHVQKTVGS